MLVSKGLAGRSGSVLLDAASASSSLLPEVPALCSRAALFKCCGIYQDMNRHKQGTDHTL